MLEHASAPLLEIKWGQIKGSFSHARHLRQISSRHNKSLGKTLRNWTLPADWQKSTGSFQAGGFQWQGPHFSGVGATLYCPVCRTATLIQFYQKNPDVDDAIALALLASFQDHRNDDQILWAAFDIKAWIPAYLKLWQHRFSAGYFELKFTSKAHTVTLTRWGPASILLSGRDLKGFAESVAPFPSSAPPPVFVENLKTMEWRFPQTAGRWSHLLNRIRIQPFLQQLRMWHLEEKNRILAVRVEGRRPLPPTVFDKICKGFGCV
ncbi:MAG: hypothetical protein AB1427_18320 [Thermodesulfobacteriota bacterium]